MFQQGSGEVRRLRGLVKAIGQYRDALLSDRHICKSCSSLVFNRQPFGLWRQCYMDGFHGFPMPGFSLCWSNDFGANSCWEGAARLTSSSGLGFKVL